jgi:hypothetical protein
MPTPTILAQQSLKNRDKLMKKELARRNLSVTDWEQNSLILLESHQFYTSYCKDLLEAGKQKNMAKIKKKIEQQPQDNASTKILSEEGSKGKNKKMLKAGRADLLQKAYKPCCALPLKIICA